MGELAASGTARYAVTDLLGQGGMGAVYAALDTRTNTKVALKRLRTSGRSAHQRNLVEFFHQEFRTLAQLAHPHVVQVHDFGSDEQGPYYTMELLEGESLHALAPLGWREVCALVRDVCSAVALLHSRRLLHRDLSPKNMQRTPDGRAKLIDFGAMTPMGPTKNLVGTPPLVPPEALLQQPLDGRADLFALGGTLYYTLTGAHAYPARQIAELRGVWQRAPAPPSARVPDIPPELDHLVLSLLSLEPVARPSSAAEVLDRLAAIASLPRDEQLSVQHAYLSTPELVGRSQELTRIRTQLADLHAGHCHVLAIEGTPGAGRSRMLDTCVLEAKLAGMTVVRADAADGVSPYGGASSLARQLWDALGPIEQASLGGEALALLRRGGIDADQDARRRVELQAALQSLLRAGARAQPVVLAIDDFERCDEPSQAALAAAASACRRERVLFAFSCEAGTEPSGQQPLALLRNGALRLPLSPFGRDDTEALLASVFGDVPNLHAVAERIHERAEGNPRDCMVLAQYLVDRELVSYEMGCFQLPPTLGDADLPVTLSRARLGKLEALSGDARELCTALALADGAGLDLDAYASLTAHGDQDRVRLALDDLLLAQILRSESATYLFEAQVWVQELTQNADPAQRVAACARIADALERRGRDRLDVARYRWRAEQRSRAIDTLLAELAEVGTRWQRAPRDYASLLRDAVQSCRALDRPRRDYILLLRELMRVGQDLALPDMREHVTELIAQLCRDCGLDRYDPATAPSEPIALLQQVVGPAQKQYDEGPELERGFSPIEAVVMLSRVCAETCAIAAQTGDVTLFELIPPLAPFFPLSRAIARVEEYTVRSCRAVVAARYEQARELYEASLREYMQPNLAGIDGELLKWAIHAIYYALGCIEGGLGRATALQYAEKLEQAPGWLVPAYSVLQIYYLTLGDLRQAERYRRLIELTLLQSPVKPPLSAGAVHQHLFVFALGDNPNGLRHALPELEALAESFPNIQSFVLFARAEHARICGNYEDALEQLATADARIRAGEHPLWPWVARTRLLALFGLQRYAEMHALAEQLLSEADRVGLEVMRQHVEIPLALAQAKLGELREACTRMDAVIAIRVEGQMEGVVLGWVHEVRARIALWMNDVATFDHHAQLCAQQYKKGDGEPALAAKYERLMQEARKHGVELRPELTDAMVVTHTTHERTGQSSSDETRRTVVAELTACETRSDRLRRALDLLVGSAQALHGELFLLGASGLTSEAVTAEGLGGEALRPALARMLEADPTGDEQQTVLTAPLALRGPTQPDGTASSVWPMLLNCSRGQSTAIAGVIALHFHVNAPVRLPLEIAVATAETLIVQGDVEPLLVSGSGVAREA